MSRPASLTLVAVLAALGVFLWPTQIRVLGTDVSCGTGPVALLRADSPTADPASGIDNALTGECRTKAAERAGLGAGVLILGTLLARAAGFSESDRRRIFTRHVAGKLGPGDPYLRCFACSREGNRRWPCKPFLKAGGLPPPDQQQAPVAGSLPTAPVT